MVDPHIPAIGPTQARKRLNQRTNESLRQGSFSLSGVSTPMRRIRSPCCACRERPCRRPTERSDELAPSKQVPSPSTTIVLKHPYFADDMKLASYGYAPTEVSPGPKQQASPAHGVFRLCHLQAYAETFVGREGVGLAMRDDL
jgi:hypothetical protein